MKILFLDIDGVLNTDKFRSTYGNETLNPYLVHNLVNIVFNTDTKIVISSAWKVNLQTIFDAMECRGFMEALSYPLLEKLTSSVIDVTLDFGTREQEIMKWVESHKEDIENWVAIDDLSLNLPSQHFVHTNPKSGLTTQKTKEVIQKLHEKQSI